LNLLQIIRVIFSQYNQMLRIQSLEIIATFLSIFLYKYLSYIYKLISFFIVFENLYFVIKMTHHAIIAKISFARIAKTFNALLIMRTIIYRRIWNRFHLIIIFNIIVSKNFIKFLVVVKIYIILFLACLAEKHFPIWTFLTFLLVFNATWTG
jgi:hypothetical protein